MITAPTTAAPIRERWRTARIAGVVLLLVLTWVVREFTVGGTLWYGSRIAGIPSQYFFIAGLAVALMPAILKSPKIRLAARLRFMGLQTWTIIALTSIGVAVAVGVGEGVPEPFADWRNFVVMILVVVLATRWLASKSWGHLFLLDFSIAVGLASFFPLTLWIAGSGENTLGIRVPIFDGPTLQVSTFASLVTAAVWLSGSKGLSRGYATAVQAACIGSSALALLSLRRSYWVIWVVGVIGLLILQIRRRGLSTRRAYAAIGVLAIVGGSVAVALGPDVVGDRIESFLPGAENRFTVTNADHLGDVLDAMDVIVEEPILGYGIGKFYATKRIVEWKEVSFEVHNLLVHTWLKFGIFGLIAYLGLTYRWIQRLLTSRYDHEIDAQVFAASGVFLIGEFVASLFGTSWYQSLQLAILHAVMLAALLALVPSYQPKR